MGTVGAGSGEVVVVGEPNGDGERLVIVVAELLTVVVVGVDDVVLVELLLTLEVVVVDSLVDDERVTACTVLELPLEVVVVVVVGFVVVLEVVVVVVVRLVVVVVVVVVVVFLVVVVVVVVVVLGGPFKQPQAWYVWVMLRLPTAAGCWYLKYLH